MKAGFHFSKPDYRVLLLALVIFCCLISCWPWLTQAGTVNLEVGIGTNASTEGISYYIGMVYRFAAAIVGVVAVIMIVIGGIQYSAAAGNKAVLGSAKETITSAIIGLVIVLMSYLILGVFSSKFVNLTEPVLEPVSVPQTELPSGTYYICGSDQPTPLCHAMQGVGTSDAGCSSYLDGKPCGSTNLPDCENLPLPECRPENNCHICTINGTQTCEPTTFPCSSNCQDNCLGQFYGSCMKTEAGCEAYCNVNGVQFPPIFANGVCSGCGEKWWYHLSECESFCGNAQNCEWDQANNQGTCSDAYRNQEYEAAKKECERNKANFADYCNEHQCGAPAETNKNGVLDYCCTNR